MNAQTPSPAPPPIRPARRPHFRRRAAGLVLVLVVSGLLVPALVGCGSSDPGEETGSTVPQAPESMGMLAPPGLYDLEGGRTQALGVLVYRDIEGGFWAVVDAVPPDSGDEATVIAVLVGAEELGVDLKALEGALVVADGKLADGASSRMAGPELVVDSISEATDTVVVPSGDQAK